MCTVTYLCMYNCIHVYMYQWRSIRFKSTCAWPGTWNNAMQWKDILLKDLNCNILSPTPPYILDSDKKRVNADFSFKNPNHQIFPWDGLNSAWTWSWANFCAAYRCNDDLGNLGLAIKTLLPLSTAQCAVHKSPMKHKVDIKQIAQWTAQVSRDRVFVQFEMHKFVQLGVNCTRTHRSRELCSGADNMMSTLCTW